MLYGLFRLPEKRASFNSFRHGPLIFPPLLMTTNEPYPERQDSQITSRHPVVHYRITLPHLPISLSISRSSDRLCPSARPMLGHPSAQSHTG